MSLDYGFYDPRVPPLLPGSGIAITTLTTIEVQPSFLTLEKRISATINRLVLRYVVFHKYQHGFTKYHGTEQAIVEVGNTILNNHKFIAVLGLIKAILSRRVIASQDLYYPQSAEDG